MIDKVRLCHSLAKLRVLSLLAVAISTFLSQPALCAPITYTPELADNPSIAEASTIPFPKLGEIKLPKGSVDLEDGTLSLTIIPEFNFDRVPVLKGPVIKTAVVSTGREAIVSGVVIFTSGYWYQKFFRARPVESVTTSTGNTITGSIVSLSPTVLTLGTANGGTVDVPLADLKEIHSERAFAFAIPALAANPVTINQSFTADAKMITLTPTTVPLQTAAVHHDQLLAGDGDWSTSKLVVLGTALSLVQAAQFVPELVLPQFSHHLWDNANKRSFFSNTNGGANAASFAPLQPNGSTYNILGSGPLGPIPSPVLTPPSVAPILQGR